MRFNLPNFEHSEVKSVEQACNVLTQYKEQACVIAGGTDLLVRMKYRALEPKLLVNLKGISSLDRIEEENSGGVIIGALTKLHKIEGSPLIRDRYPIVSQAASRVAHRLIRNMGTIGGNICSDSRCEYYTHSHLFGFEYWPKCFKRGGEFLPYREEGNVLLWTLFSGHCACADRIGCESKNCKSSRRQGDSIRRFLYRSRTSGQYFAV